MAEPEEEARSTASNKRSRSELEENQVNGLFPPISITGI